MTISDIIKKERVTQGLTQEELAEKVGITAIYISELEQSKSQLSLRTNLPLRMAEALGLDKRDFIQKILYERSSPEARAILFEKTGEIEISLSDDQKEFLDIYESLCDITGRKHGYEIMKKIFELVELARPPNSYYRYYQQNLKRDKESLI